MRRLYSTFADGWPGMGLLLMRLVVGVVLLHCAGWSLWARQPLDAPITSAILAGSGLLLIAGLWSPIAGAVVALVGVVRLVAFEPHALTSLLVATMSAALAMLGPGRWSLDARLFGWKRIEAFPRKN